MEAGSVGGFVADFGLAHRAGCAAVPAFEPDLKQLSRGLE